MSTSGYIRVKNLILAKSVTVHLLSEQVLLITLHLIQILDHTHALIVTKLLGVERHLLFIFVLTLGKSLTFVMSVGVDLPS